MAASSDQQASNSANEPGSPSSPAAPGNPPSHGLLKRLLYGGLFLAAIAGGFLWKDRLVGAAHTLLPTPNAGRQVLHWTSPMDSDFRSDKPGKDAMGMDLVPVYAGQQAPSGPTVIDPVLSASTSMPRYLWKRGRWCEPSTRSGPLSTQSRESVMSH